MHKNSKRFLALVMALTLMLALFTGGVQAADYQGSGTASDPYLVKTPEDLDNIRKNLSAHYKLAATIDLSSIENFKPIGTIAKPFTGSFVCPLNTDGQPLYAILNLKIHTAAGPYIDAGMSKWEAALFSAIENSTFSNILVLNAFIQNDNIGDNSGAVIYGNYKPGMDDMPTSPLIGYATNSTVTGCGTTGVIDAHSNGCGGIIGHAKGTSVINCWSTVEVSSSGKWNLGGLIGHAGDSSVVSGCWATGNVQNGTACQGALIGSLGGSVVQNCYATGNAPHGFIGRGEQSTVMNSYYTGNDTSGDFQDIANTISNVFVLSGKNPTLDGMKEASEAEITAAMKNIKGWDTTGTLPTLLDTKMPPDLNAYQVGATVGTPDGNDVTPPVEDTPAPTNPETQPSEEPTIISLEEFLTLLEQLPVAENVTLEHKESIQKLYTAVETYSDAGDIEPIQHKQVVDCFKALEVLIVGDLGNKIQALPEPDQITQEHKAAVDAILVDYNFLDEEYRSYIAEELRTKLDAIQAKLKELESTQTDSTASAYTAGEITVLIILAVIICLNVATNSIIAITLYRKKKTEKN